MKKTAVLLKLSHSVSFRGFPHLSVSVSRPRPCTAARFSVCPHVHFSLPLSCCPSRSSAVDPADAAVDWTRLYRQGGHKMGGLFSGRAPRASPYATMDAAQAPAGGEDR